MNRPRVSSPEPPRRLLVVASQCEHVHPLAGLEGTARDLHAVLTDPARGACVPYEHVSSLLMGEGVQVGQVETALRESMAAAGGEGAVLVLAFIGHGFAADHGSRLLYRTTEIDNGRLSGALDVGHWIATAADTIGVEGVIGLVDTCHAGAAAGAFGDLAGGIRQGRHNVRMLMSSSIDQNANGMIFTKELAGLLRAGIPTGDPFVFLDDALHSRLRDRVDGQVVSRADLSSDLYSMGSLWLSRNQRTSGAVRDALGEIGRKELREVLMGWQPRARVPERGSRSILERLQGSLAEPPEPAEGSEAPFPSTDLAREQVEDVLAMLIESFETRAFVMRRLAPKLKTEQIRAVMSRRGISSDGEEAGAELLRHAVEHAVLRAPTVSGSRWKPLARLIADLAAEAGIRADDRELAGWADRLEAHVELNDAVEFVHRERDRQEYRLVIMFDASVTDWPDQIETRLLHQGTALSPTGHFACVPADRGGAELAIMEAIAWATKSAGIPGLVTGVDVAAPAHLLAAWYPEEADLGTYYFGAEHDVVVRWSGRTAPKGKHAEINRVARETLRTLCEVHDPHGVACAPVDWVSREDLVNVVALAQRLKAGGYRRAIGIDHCAEELHGVLELVLPYSPIVLWPRPADSGAWDRSGYTSLLDKHWRELPGGFATAYRQRLLAQSDGDCAPSDPIVDLAVLRAAWHDEQWLEFCHWFENRTVASPEEPS